jgi:exonuclease III
MKFRLQQTKSMFYTDKKLANELVINFWEDWVESKVVDPKYANLDENTIGCSRLPHGKYQYQIYLKKKLAWQISEEKRTALLKFLDHNVENVYVANGGLIDWLEGKDTWYPASYFYVTDERYLSPLYVIAGDFIEKVIQFKKVKNAGNKKIKR